jgi:hypothetical protein
MLGHKSAAMTLDTHADLSDDDPEALAERLAQNVGKMWAQKCMNASSGSADHASTERFVPQALAPPDGLEPSTVRLTVGSSAN